jgi:hypothetical protein
LLASAIHIQRNIITTQDTSDLHPLLHYISAMANLHVLLQHHVQLPVVERHERSHDTSWARRLRPSAPTDFVAFSIHKSRMFLLLDLNFTPPQEEGVGVPEYVQDHGQKNM